MINELSREGLSLAIATTKLKPDCSATETSKNVEMLHVFSLYTLLSANDKGSDQTVRMQQTQFSSRWVHTFSYFIPNDILYVLNPQLRSSQ